MTVRRKSKFCKVKSTEEVHKRTMHIPTGKLVEQVNGRRTRLQSKLGFLEEAVQRNTKDMPTGKRSRRTMVTRKDSSKKETPIALIGSSTAGTRKSSRKSSVDKIPTPPPIVSTEKLSRKPYKASISPILVTPAAKPHKEETPIAHRCSPTAGTRKSLRKSSVDKVPSPPPIVSTEKLSKKPYEASPCPILVTPAAKNRGSLKRMGREKISEASPSKKQRSTTPPLESPEKSQEAPIKANPNPAISTRKSHHLQSLEVENLENITTGDHNLVMDKEVPKEVATPAKESTQKNTRGPTKMKTLAVDIDSRLEVKFNSTGQPIGETSVTLSSFLGPLVREIVPITIPDWRKVTKELKDILWNYVQARYKVDEDWQKRYIIRSMADLWRASKSRLVAKLQEAPNEEVRLKLRPKNIKSADEWKTFVREKTSSEFKAKSEKFRERRKNYVPHTCSRKGYARLIDDLMNDSASKEVPSRIDVWTKAHKKKNGEPINADVAETFELVEEYKKDTIMSSVTGVNEDILSKVIGPEKNSYVRAYGRGVTQTKLAIGSMRDGYMTHLKGQRKELKEKMIHMEHMIQLKDQYKELKERMTHMDQLIHSLMKNQNQSDQTVEQSHIQVSGDMNAKVNTHGDRCKILDWCGSGETIADGHFISSDPKDLVHHIPLGPNAMKVGIDSVRQPGAFLWRPTPTITCIEEAVGNTIAWPADKIIMSCKSTRNRKIEATEEGHAKMVDDGSDYNNGLDCLLSACFQNG
ncbi:uncharacterized protein LOC133807298 [Humulus lupulus]|uniref:uncharacterized protein LOC133807298 n=1 Tax=Humulus lupulus TaxID=3486 RepID=UPI002B417BE1|nr:uncharacterized protein LOC133807298 [Humulus lupulus]